MTSIKDIALTLGLLVLYVLGIIHVGFFVSSFIYLALHMRILGLRSPLVTLMVATGTPLVLYGVVEMFLNVSMPHGILF